MFAGLSFSSVFALHVITEGRSLVREGGGSAGGLLQDSREEKECRSASNSILAWRLARRRETLRSHFAVVLFILTLLEESLPIFNVGASDDAIEA